MSQLEPLYGTLGVTHRDEQVAAASRLSTVFDGADLFARLDAIATATTGPAVFTTSFGLEDQAIAHAILSRGLPIDIVTLDTGRLFPETYDVWAKTEARYATRIRAAYPRHDALEALVSDQGIDGFYRSLQARKACCNVRKVEPLARALSGAAAWVTGLRGDQSDQRKGVSAVEVDDDRGLIKANPLFDWSRDEVLEFTARARRTRQRAACEGLPLDRLRALHPRRCARRTRAGRPLVVGRRSGEGMRPSRRRGRPAGPRQRGGDAMIQLTHLQKLEAEAIHIIREVVATCENPVLLYSIGKDSAVLLHLALKAFYPGPLPFPLLHVDTTWKFREMIAFRDRRG